MSVYSRYSRLSRRIIATLACIVLLQPMLAVCADTDVGYKDYISGADDFCGHKVVLQPEDFIGGTEDALKDEFDGRSAIITSGDGDAKWTAVIPEMGYYSMRLEYLPLEGSGSAIQRNVLIDGALPFDEAAGVKLTRSFMDAAPIEHRDGKNDIWPEQIETFEWLSAYIKDARGFFGDRLYFKLTAGSHTITLEAVSEPMAVGAIILESVDGASGYETVLDGYGKRGIKSVSGVLDGGVKIIQAEDAYRKSDRSLYPVVDNSSPGNQPYSYANQKLNTIGGAKWKYSGQWISWHIDVPQSGLYEIGFRSKQNFARDINSVRRLLIDGQLQFAEAAELIFSYSSDWQVASVGGDVPFLFYLEQGVRTITMEVTLGEFGGLLMLADESISALNAANWDLLTILGATPDLYRDYNIAEYCPEVIEAFNTQAVQLQSIADEWVRMTGSRDSNVAQIEQIIYQLKEMSGDPDRIPALYPTFKDNVSSFANLIVNAEMQSLSLDYLFIAEQSTSLPKANVGFFSALKYAVLKFLVSFVTDYNSLSDLSDISVDTEPVRVWIGNGLSGGRDQAIELNNLILQDFTVKKGIPVNLEIVPPSTILVATLSGAGPDVALQITGKDPANYAMRNAVEDLSGYKGFDLIAASFSEQAFVPFKYQNGIYALPETVSFPVMFYRSDILDTLGIDITAIKTWDDLIDLLPVLQRKNMNIAIPANFNSYYMFLFQSGGGLFKNGNTSSDLDSKTALNAFDNWMSFYTSYGLPIAYSFAQRFRTGEIPIGIEDYTQYNLLKMAAPEINGRWGMAAIPGTLRDDGSIDSSAPISPSGSILMSAAKNKQNAWEFLKWYTSEDIQFEFGNRLESVMGVGARYNTANIKALGRLPWQKSERETLFYQMERLVGVPEIPGGYLTSRNIGFAMNSTYNENADARKTLLSYVEQINQEITLKRKEFGLDTNP